MLSDPIFAFDLDGTITTQEMVPLIAQKAGLFNEMSLLTRLTTEGGIDFAASFRLRVAMLRHIPLAAVHAIAKEIPLNPRITAFIREHTDRCAIVTGNLDCWIAPITEKLGCSVFCSHAEIHDEELRLAAILDKAEAIRNLARSGRPVIAIGDGANDIPMFHEANYSIAYGGVRRPSRNVSAAADETVCDDDALCRILENCL